MLIRERAIPIELINAIGIRSIEIEQARVLLDRMMGEIKPGQEYRIRHDERISEDPATNSVKMRGSLQTEEEDNGQLWVPCASGIMPKIGEKVLVTDMVGSIRHCDYVNYGDYQEFETVEENMTVKAVAWRPLPKPYVIRESNELDCNYYYSNHLPGGGVDHRHE